MRAPLQVLSGLAAVVGLLVFGWALTGRPTVDAARIGSCFQAVGAAVEVYALLRIAWKPWVLPTLRRLRAALGSEILKLRRTLHRAFPSIFPPVERTTHLGLADLAVTADLRASGVKRRGGTVEERITSLEEDYENYVNTAAARFRELEDAVKEGKVAASEQLSEVEETALRIRTDDAVRLLLGVTLSLVGTVWSSIG